VVLIFFVNLAHVSLVLSTTSIIIA